MALVEEAIPASGVNRRQMLRIVAAAAAVPVVIGAVRWLGPAPAYYSWSGETMGTLASLTLWHNNADYAQRTINRMMAEVARLENVFSLFRPGSELSQLNAEGLVASPSRDLAEVIAIAQRASDVSGGLFDVSVQALWRLYEAYFARAGANPIGPDAADIRAVLPLVDYTAIETGRAGIRLGRAGMALTLNAVAQGYITDRIADLLRNDGFDHVVVELGETRVLGNRPDGQAWEIGIRDRTGYASQTIGLSDQALSVSGGYGTVFEPTGRANHIFNPDTGRSADGTTTVAVTHDRAAVADALSTAIVVAGEERAPALLAAYPGATALITRGDGSTLRL